MIEDRGDGLFHEVERIRILDERHTEMRHRQDGRTMSMLEAKPLIARGVKLQGLKHYPDFYKPGQEPVGVKA